MAKKKEENEELIVDVQEVYSKTETFVENNKNVLSGVIIAIIIGVGSFFAYNNLYLEPLQLEAAEAMFKAEQSFDKDSLEQAIYGTDEFAGFIEIADEYGATRSGNLANYYLGLAFLKRGEYTNAIEAFNQFDGDDEILGTIALGAQGDAYLELGDYEKAASYYEKAASREKNEFTSPIYLMKAGKTYELNSQFSDALAAYEKIKTDWKKSPEATDIEKYIARVESAAK